MKGVVLAGGRGTRLRPITHTGPKQLVPIANKPVIQYVIEDLREAGVTEIGVVLGNLGRQEIQAFLGDGSDFGVDITYIVQGNPLGIAHAAGCARSFVGDDDFVLYLGDNLLDEGVASLVDSFEEGEYAAGIALQRVDDPTQFGVAEIDDDGTVQRLVEKPDKPPSDLALIGTYVFSPAIFEAIETLDPSWRGELEITDSIGALLDRDLPVDSHVVEGWWKDTGKPEDVLEANRLVLKDRPRRIEGTIEAGAEVVGAVEVPASSTIETGAVVRGPVSLGESVTVGQGTYVGPYTAIGDNSEIRTGHLENTVVAGDATIATNETIVDSLIGRGTTIESSAEVQPAGTRLTIAENSRLSL